VNDDLKHRLGGILSIVGGFAVGWWGIWLPYQAVLARAAEVEYHTSVFVLAPSMIVFGIFFVIFGARVPYRNVTEQNLTKAGWILFAVVAVSAGLSFWWLLDLFGRAGYRAGV